MSTDTEYALQTLGLPDSPAIHLAICTVAELLQPLDASCSASSRDKCIVRFRVASHAVREGLPIEYSRLQYLWRFGTDINHETAEAALRLPRTDWLGRAKAALEAIGVDPGPDAQKMATRYEWRPDLGRAHLERSSGGSLRWDPVWKLKPRTDTERSKLLQEVVERVKSATPEQKKAALERSRQSSAVSPKPSTKV
jgi:hypothetical protein